MKLSDKTTKSRKWTWNCVELYLKKFVGLSIKHIIWTMQAQTYILLQNCIEIASQTFFFIDKNFMLLLLVAHLHPLQQHRYLNEQLEDYLFFVDFQHLGMDI